VAQLHKVAEWSGQKRANVVFVHGLGGHPSDTWQSTEEMESFWPRWLGEDVPGLSVFTLGYYAPFSDWQGRAMPFTDLAKNAYECLLANEDLHDGPIIFICHSLGGLLVKEALRLASERKGQRPAAASLLSRVEQVIFMATPHTGSFKATWLERLDPLTRPSELARSLRDNAPFLRSLNESYRILAESLDGQISHLVFTEMEDTSVGEIVDPSSSDPGLSNSRVIPVLADHNTVCKPPNRRASPYTIVHDAVSRIGAPPQNAGVLHSYIDGPITVIRPRSVGVGAAARSSFFSLAVLAFVALAYVIWLSKQPGYIEALDALNLASHVEQELREGIESAIDSGPVGEVAVDTFLRDNLRKGLDAALYPAQFRVFEASYKSLLDAARSLSGETVGAAEQSIIELIEDGELSKAQAELEDLIALRNGSSDNGSDAGVQDARTIAYLTGLSGQLAETRSDYDLAAEHFDSAAVLASRNGDDTWRFRISAANAYRTKGLVFGDAADLVEAIKRYGVILETPDLSPSEEIETLRNRASARILAGSASCDTAELGRAKDDLLSAVALMDGDQAAPEPVDVMSEFDNSYGLTLLERGRCSGSLTQLRLAKDFYENVFETLTFEAAPEVWAAAQNNYAGVLQIIGERENDAQSVEDAVGIYENLRDKISELNDDSARWHVAHNIGVALRILGKMRNDEQALEKSIKSYNDALAEAVADSQQAARSLGSQGVAMIYLGALTGSSNDVAIGIQQVSTAIELLEAEAQEYWPARLRCQRNVGQDILEQLSAETATATIDLTSLPTCEIGDDALAED
jgi:tetratricopeptide (TPR) repeat protein